MPSPITAVQRIKMLYALRLADPVHLASYGMGDVFAWLAETAARERL